MADAGNVPHAHPEDAGIVDLKCRNIGVVCIVRLCRSQIFRTDKPPPHDENGENDPQNAERVGDGTTQCGAVGGDIQLIESLLCRAERRRVGRSAAHHAHHLRQGHRCETAQKKSQADAEHDDSESEQVEPYAPFVE